MSRFWAKIIPVRWPRLAARTAAVLVLLSCWSQGQTLETRARALREKPSAQSRAALERFARAHPRDRDGALARLALAVHDFEQGRAADAARALREARPRLAPIGDYVSYYLAFAEHALGNFESSAREAESVAGQQPPSPLDADAVLLAARAHRDRSAPADAVALLRSRNSELRQSAADALLASCYRAANDLANAAAAWQRVYYNHPASPEAGQAAQALNELRRSLGDLMPPASADNVMTRAERLARAGEYRRAREEYQAIAAQPGAPHRDLARVRVGVMDYYLYQNITAYSHFRDLVVENPDADAERLYYLLECGRRLDREDVIRDAIAGLERHATSPWRLRALVSAGNRYLVENQADQFLPLYRACFESFPRDARADYCHWKVTWYTYVNRRADAADMLREHLVKFPGSERASGALYFLGRLAEAAREFETAKAYYVGASERFPNHYYAELADQRLADSEVLKSPASTEVAQFLKTIVWPLSPRLEKFDASPATQARIERAEMLNAAGLEDLAERELRFAAVNDGQPHVAAIHLAGAAAKYDSPHRALRLAKSLVPGYLSIPLEAAPPSFWRLLFPLPWRAELERHSRNNGIDPFLVAGLVRQESEFNPQAVSPARAYGLTQILPSTGRSLLKMSRRRFRPTILFRPELNLRLGTAHLRGIMAKYADKWELTLASYNAGGSRVERWLTWGEYREPAEFIESIPFTETRTYVTAVLRNALIYRRLYNGDGLLADSLKVRKPAVSSNGGGFERAPAPRKKRPRPRK